MLRMFVNTVLKVGRKRDEWGRGVEETACEEIRDLYFSSNIMWVIKSGIDVSGM